MIAMKSAVLRKLAVLLTALTVAGTGCTHTQRPERRVHVISHDVSGIDFNDARGTGGAGAEAYCAELQKQCFTKCWRRKPDIPSIEKHSGKHHEHCTTKCLEVFNQCVKEQEELERQDAQKKELHFPTMDAALDWLRNHTAEAPPGTNVVVTGVAFVVALMAGALVLSPL
ncbi:hypothetical protein [Archangium sp.]|uniref:hypothetical protein n=1 Tax=Archangium sp. TaxID=1872627 RepID=UPI002D48BF37|nr:hypothetical protein [Archangium sp.]HYO57480.1 hypothetical protein [Archangium sp.]